MQFRAQGADFEHLALHQEEASLSGSGDAVCLLVFQNRIKNPVARVKYGVGSHIKWPLQVS